MKVMIDDALQKARKLPRREREILWDPRQKDDPPNKIKALGFVYKFGAQAPEEKDVRVRPVLTIGDTTIIEGRTGGDHGYVELASNFTNPGAGADDAINTIITTGPDAIKTAWDKARGKRPQTYVPSTKKKVDEYSELDSAEFFGHFPKGPCNA